MMRRWIDRYAIFLALIIECLILALATDGFLTANNLTNVLRQNAFTAVLAAGMTFVIISGAIDLSVGSIVALSGVLCADAMARGSGMMTGVIIGVAAGILIGAINGLVVTRLRVPAFIVTLAMMLVARGGAFKYTDARTITGLPASFGLLSSGTAALAIMAAVFVGSWLILTRTPFGRHVYAVGGNMDAAWLSGIRVTRVQLIVFMVSGACAGIAGVLVASRLNAGYPRAGEFYELDAIAAVVVGGTSLFGGRGSIWGALAGAFFVGVLNNGLNLFQVSPYDQLMVKGGVLLAAACLDRSRQ
jgi:ribose/xylose/arabinose/galactoside ABC-type transport system permease subunit